MFCTSCQMYKSAWKHRLILPPTGCLKIHFDFRYVFSFFFFFLDLLSWEFRQINFPVINGIGSKFPENLTGQTKI